MAGYYYYIPFLSPLILMAGRWASPANRNLLWIISATFLICFVGLRDEVGGDWHVYTGWVEDARDMNPLDALLFTDSGYAFVNWIGANTFGGIYVVNLICAALAIVPLFYFCSKQDDPILALVVAIPYLVVVVFMGYTRQSVAIGFGMIAILAAQRRNTVTFLVWVTLAALFHRSAVILFALSPALYLPKIDRKVIIRTSWCFAYAILLTTLLFRESAIHMAQQYIFVTGDGAPSVATGISSSSDVASGATSEEAGLYSAGAIIRLLQSVLAVAAFFIVAMRHRLYPAAFWLWSIVSTVVIALFLLAFWRSTLADRWGLFFIPLQLFAFSTLPLVLPNFWRVPARASILLGSVASLWVWLNFGHYASSWLPYRNLLLP